MISIQGDSSKTPLAAVEFEELSFDNDEVRKNPCNGSNRNSQRLKEWLSCTSTTSDYDSNREPFESGSWSSTSRRSSTNSNVSQFYS